MDEKTRRAQLEMYIAGVEVRRELTRKERIELRYAWLAGFIAGQTSESDAGAKP